MASLMPCRIAVFSVLFLFISATYASLTFQRDYVPGLADHPAAVRPCAFLPDDSGLTSGASISAVPVESVAPSITPEVLTSNRNDSFSRDCFAAATHPVIAIADSVADESDSMMLEPGQVQGLAGFLALGLLVFLVRFRMLAGSRGRLL